MFGPQKLDRNKYVPQLDDIQESANRTYGEANSFYRKETLYLEDIEDRIKKGELSKPEDMYDESHAIASDLAKCCEMYLKALYIYENNVPGNKIDEIWNKLKNKDFQTDENGNLIYHNKSNDVITFLKYDSDGNPLTDSSNKKIYFDANGNEYNENNRGSKIPRNGHQLDKLIELISPESRLYLETRMIYIPMAETEKNKSISILDILQKRGLIDSEEYMTKKQYIGWVDQHKKTFEESRYSGQKNCDVNIEFLYHLATQIKAVVQYRIQPSKKQNFKVTEEEYSKLPFEIRQLAIFNSKLISEELIKLVSNNEKVRNRLRTIFSNEYNISTGMDSTTFCNMLKLMNINEIFYVSSICYLFDNYESFISKINDSNTKQTKEMLDTVKMIIPYHLNSEKIVYFLCYIKTIFGEKFPINNESLKLLFNTTRERTVIGNICINKNGISPYNVKMLNNNNKYNINHRF